MSSSSAPTYYFSGINFNNSYYGSSSSASSSIFLKKTMADSAQGVITFNAGLNSNSLFGKLTTDAISVYSTTTGTITLGSATSTLNVPNTIATVGNSNISLFDTQTRQITAFAGLLNYPLNIANNLTSGSIWVATGGTNQTGTINIGNNSFTTNANFTTGVVNINCPTVLYQPLVLNSASLPTSNLQLGNICYSFGYANKITTTANNVIGTYTAYTANTLLPIGTYLISMSSCIGFTSGGTSFSGNIVSSDCGFYQGTNATITLNTKTLVDKLPGATNSFSQNGANTNYEFGNSSWSITVQNTTQVYIAGYITYTISAAFTSTSSITEQAIIKSFSITRIG